MKQFTVNLPTSKADLLGMCEAAGRLAARAVKRTRESTGNGIIRTGTTIVDAGKAVHGSYTGPTEANAKEFLQGALDA